MDEHETLHDFRERLGEEPVYAHPQAARRELWEVRKVFKEWIRDAEFQKLELPLAKLLEETIDFETNRPYEPWYRRPESFHRRAVAGLEKQVAAWVDAAPALGEPASRKSERRRAATLVALLRPYQRRNAGRSAHPAWRWLVRLWWMVRLEGIWNWRQRRRWNRLIEE